MRLKNCALTYLILLLSPVVALGGSIGHDLILELPFGWAVISDTLAFPVHIVNDAASAQMSVFRSEFDGANVVRNEAELKASVDRVVNEVILTLPESRLLTSTGFNRTDRAGFIVEFVSRDSTADLELRHRFEGVLYRLENGNQVMFTLWAKVPKDKYVACEEEIRDIQASFEFNGAMEAVVFPPRLPKHMVTIVLMMIAAALSVVAYRNRVKAASRNGNTAHDSIGAHRPSRAAH